MIIVNKLNCLISHLNLSGYRIVDDHQALVNNNSRLRGQWGNTIQLIYLVRVYYLIADRYRGHDSWNGISWRQGMMQCVLTRQDG